MSTKRLQPDSSVSVTLTQKNNVADVLTKPLDNQTFHHLIRPFFFRNPGEPRWPLEHKVLSVFDPLAMDPSVQTPPASVSEQPLTSGRSAHPIPQGNYRRILLLHLLMILKKHSSHSGEPDSWGGILLYLHVYIFIFIWGMVTFSLL